MLQLNMPAEARTYRDSAEKRRMAAPSMAMKAWNTVYPVNDAGHFDMLFLNRITSSTVPVPDSLAALNPWLIFAQKRQGSTARSRGREKLPVALRFICDRLPRDSGTAKVAVPVIPLNFGQAANKSQAYP